jgi:hypothetical protein
MFIRPRSSSRHQIYVCADDAWFKFWCSNPHVMV